VDATCPSGSRAISGGYFVIRLDPAAPPVALSSWRPTPDKWEVAFYNPSDHATIQVQVIAYCAAT
jgi:hypothetical protein